MSKEQQLRFRGHGGNDEELVHRGDEESASLVGTGAMARAEIASVSAKAGPFGVKVGLGFDTGASAGLDGVEAKVLGTGFSVGPRTGVAVLGNEASCSVM
ncbi:uncharacterized protein LOC131549541 [Onychostoma macrolepis]|uniref:Uncharacterized protein n=1 Tax=Onychostoma macrolepis TaxID=369639 RepID=A0A7J6CK98_9TELE|nr:uncharacterized protein LOC131549541 [Onychostoma macrolepis]KAF4107749.1 hypothetical protein G5714_012113 [Onychostoma macrolepis]